MHFNNIHYHAAFVSNYIVVKFLNLIYCWDKVNKQIPEVWPSIDQCMASVKEMLKNFRQCSGYKIFLFVQQMHTLSKLHVCFYFIACKPKHSSHYRPQRSSVIKQVDWQMWSLLCCPSLFVGYIFQSIHFVFTLGTLCRCPYILYNLGTVHHFEVTHY